MKRFTRLISFTLATIMLFSLIPISASAVTLVKDMKIVCFGDSLTHFGSYKSGAIDEYGNAIYVNSYPDHLATFTGAEVYNAGRGGDSTDMAATRLQNEVINQNPDVVVICLGMNDQAYNSTNTCSMTSVEAYRANLERFARMITAKGIDVIFLTPNPVYAPYYATRGDNYNYGNMPQYCNAMREVAIKYGCGLVDANYEYTSDSNLKNYILAGDGIHQSDTGRRYFASLVAEYLASKYENYKRAEMTIVCKDNNGKVLKQYTIVGTEGALITIPSPDLGEGYTAITADINTTFVKNATHTFTYESTVSTAITNALNANVDTNMSAYISMLVNNATNLLSASELDFDDIGKTTVLLQNAINDVAVLSYGATYSATAPTYDTYVDLDDDGIRLTDGYKSYENGWDSRYSAWSSVQPEIILDLGANVKSNTFKGYFGWIAPAGVAAPSVVNVSYSTDKINWSTAIATVKSTIGTTNTTDAKGTWNRDMFTATLNLPAEMRYVKFNIKPTGSFTWVDELEVCYDSSIVSDPDDLDASSTYTTSDLYRQGGADMNWGWDENAAITYPDEGGNSLIDGVIGAGDIMNACWTGFHKNTPEYITTGYHRITFDLGEEKNVGTVDVYFGTIALGFGVTAPASVQVLVSDNGTDFKSVKTAEPTDTANVNGFTTVEKVTLPVNKKARYVELRFVSGNWAFVSEVEITAGEVYDHVCSADENGWYKDAQNHWKECSCGELLEYSEHIAGDWIDDEQGSQVQFCTVCGYEMNSRSFMLGDINRNGQIEARDYFILKSACFDIYTLDEYETLAADINHNGQIEARDYFLLKRACFGNYIIR